MVEIYEYWREKQKCIQVNQQSACEYIESAWLSIQRSLFYSIASLAIQIFSHLPRSAFFLLNGNNHSFWHMMERVACGRIAANVPSTTAYTILNCCTRVLHTHISISVQEDRDVNNIYWNIIYTINLIMRTIFVVDLYCSQITFYIFHSVFCANNN